jgi:hypothetical protein
MAALRAVSSSRPAVATTSRAARQAAVEQRVVGPGRIGEPAVLGIHGHGRLDRTAEPGRRRDERDAREIGRQLEGDLSGHDRVDDAGPQHFGQGLTEPGSVEILEQAGLGCQHVRGALADFPGRLGRVLSHASMVVPETVAWASLPLIGKRGPDTHPGRRSPTARPPGGVTVRGEFRNVDAECPSTGAGSGREGTFVDSRAPR